MRKDVDTEYEIDLVHICMVLLSRIWIIVISTVICGAIAFGYTKLFVTPLYSAKALLYVNNSSFSIDSIIGTSTVGTARGMVSTYTIILKTRSTLNEVIKKANLSYDYDTLYKMISAQSVDETEIFSVTVTSPDPEEATLIANTIADVFTSKIGAIMKVSGVSIVDYAVKQEKRVSPSYTKNTAIGLFIGFALSCGTIVLLDFFDDVIHDEDYLNDGCEFPLLASIPDTNSKAVQYGYSYGYESASKVSKPVKRRSK